MFTSFLLHLRPLAPLSMSRHTGRYTNGLVYHLLKSVDAPLATWVHEEANPKPFTISTLQGTLHTKNGETYAVPNEKYHLRCTTLTSALYERLGDALLACFKGDRHLRINKTVMYLEQLSAPPMVGLQIGQVLDAELTAQSDNQHEITLEFSSPTAFKKDDLHLLFPQPWNVFGSLGRTWSAFSKVPLHPQINTQFLESSIAVSRHRVETDVIQGGKYQLLGFVGRCTYRIQKEVDPIVVRQLNMLADFAQYAGVGMKTTQGMGQTRRL